MKSEMQTFKLTSDQVEAIIYAVIKRAGEAMSDVDTTREQINKIIAGALAQIRPVIKPEGGTGIMGTMSASDFLRIDITDLLDQARNAALDDLLEAMPTDNNGDDSYMAAVSDITATIHQLRSSNE